MAAAIRHVTAGKGHDPRTFTLVSFGGAGGLHAVRLAEALDIPRILIPPHAGLLSALGMVVAPPLVDVSKTIAHLDSMLERRRIETRVRGIGPATARRFCRSRRRLRLERFADCRFHGQSYELTVPVESCDRPAIEENFRHAYQVVYGHCPQGRSVELVTLASAPHRAGDANRDSAGDGAGVAGFQDAHGAERRSGGGGSGAGSAGIAGRRRRRRAGPAGRSRCHRLHPPDPGRRRPPRSAASLCNAKRFKI